MKLYATTYFDDAPEDGTPPGPRVKWAKPGTQAQQKKDVKDLKAQMMHTIEAHTVEVPTDKPGLIDWLEERAVFP
jgi:hypothetical protein